MDVALTGFDDSLRPRLAAGVVVSLLAHALLAAVILVQPPAPASPAPRAVQPPAVSMEPPPIRPGIDESSSVSINWLGFTDPTEHQATPAETEQAALSPADMGSPEVVEPVEVTADAEKPEETPQPEPEIEVVTDSEQATPDETPAETVQEPVEVTEAPAEIPDPVAEVPASPPLLALRTDAPELRSTPLLQVVKRATARARALAERAAARQAAAAASAPPPGEPRDALPSEKESDATSLDKVAEWHPGKPPAVEGLDITPVRPRWTVATRLAALPRNPVVQLEFRKNGTVAKAQFLPGQATGFADVDGPLLDALYRWTARGKALDDLRADSPKVVVSFTMRIVLIPDRGTIRRSTPNR